MINRKIILSLFIVCSSAGAFAQTLKDAIHLTDNEQYEAATPAFKTLIAADPVNGTNYFYFGENYLLSDNADSAAIMFNKGKQVDPANLLNQIGLAKIKLNSL